MIDGLPRENEDSRLQIPQAVHEIVHLGDVVHPFKAAGIKIISLSFAVARLLSLLSSVDLWSSTPVAKVCACRLCLSLSASFVGLKYS